MNLNRRIKQLEDNMLQTPELGTTRLYIDDPVESELLQECQRIARMYENGNELTVEQRALMDQMTRIMWMRGLDIFEQTVGLMIHQENKIAKPVFCMWLGYFIDEAIAGLKQMIEEDTIMSQKGKTWKQKEKELAEAFGPNSEKWTKVFTRERFEKYINDFVERGLKPEVRKKLRKHRKKKALTELSNKGEKP